MEWISLADQLHPSITKHNAKHEMQWCKAHHRWTLEQWRRVLWSDERFLSGDSLMDESGFGDCQENGACLTALCQV